jgi:alkanesulfonate monooxygenase SsuD/methylene tetrahydromethanopterin reductase-like flavin-dependent oxidoreductase (luciferase family)
VRPGARAVVDGKVADSLLAGSPAAIAEHIRTYVDAGADEIVVTLLPPYDRDALNTIAEKIVPLVRESR